MFRMIYSKVGYLSLQDSTEVYKLLNGKYVMIQWANPTEYAADILKFIPTSGFETVAILGSLVGTDMDEKFVFDADCEYGGVSSMRQLSTPIPKSYKGFVGFPPGTDELEDWEYWDDNYTRAYERWIQSVCAEFDAVVSLENISTVMQSADFFQLAVGKQMLHVLMQLDRLGFNCSYVLSTDADNDNELGINLYIKNPFMSVYQLDYLPELPRITHKPKALASDKDWCVLRCSRKQSSNENSPSISTGIVAVELAEWADNLPENTKEDFEAILRLHPDLQKYYA